MKEQEQKGLRYPLCKGAYCACQQRDCIYYEFIHYKTRLCLAERKIAELEAGKPRRRAGAAYAPQAARKN